LIPGTGTQRVGCPFERDALSEHRLSVWIHQPASYAQSEAFPIHEVGWSLSSPIMDDCRCSTVDFTLELPHETSRWDMARVRWAFNSFNLTIAHCNRPIPEYRREHRICSASVHSFSNRSSFQFHKM
jgi:hypothetical protein